MWPLSSHRSCFVNSVFLVSTLPRCLLHQRVSSRISRAYYLAQLPHSASQCRFLVVCLTTSASLGLLRLISCELRNTANRRGPHAARLLHYRERHLALLDDDSLLRHAMIRGSCLACLWSYSSRLLSVDPVQLPCPSEIERPRHVRHHAWSIARRFFSISYQHSCFVNFTLTVPTNPGCLSHQCVESRES